MLKTQWMWKVHIIITFLSESVSQEGTAGFSNGVVDTGICSFKRMITVHKKAVETPAY